MVVAGDGRDSTSADFAQEQRLAHTEVEDDDAVVELVSDGAADAAILVGPILEYPANDPAGGRIDTVGGPLNYEF